MVYNIQNHWDYEIFPQYLEFGMMDKKPGNTKLQ
jgi:hypothetical protein